MANAETERKPCVRMKQIIKATCLERSRFAGKIRDMPSQSSHQSQNSKCPLRQFLVVLTAAIHTVTDRTKEIKVTTDIKMVMDQKS